MSLFVLTTDEHLTLKQPKNRIEPFFPAMLRKLEEIVQFCNENKVKKWLSGGDFFDGPTQNCEIINAVYNVLKELKCKPIVGIPGNHPIKGNYDKSIEKSGITTLNELGIFDFQKGPRIVDCDDKKVLLWHDSIVKEPVPWDHYTYEQVSDQYVGRADYCLVSHVHFSQGIETVGGLTFLSPGSLARGVGAERNIRRTPQFCVLETKKGKPRSFLRDLRKIDDDPFKEDAKDSSTDQAEHLRSIIQDEFIGFDASTMSFDKVLGRIKKRGEVSSKTEKYLMSKYEETKK